MEKVGFIGTGIMGKPMAANLLSSGFQLNIFARHPEKVKDLEEKGARSFNTIGEMSSESMVIITMLPDSPDSSEVITGEAGIIEGAGKGTLVIDMSSIDPMVSIEIGKKLEVKKIAFMDAPVSGGEEGAVKGELAIMAGGSKSDFKRAEPLFKVMGRSYILAGNTGAGNFTKLANQIMVAANIAAMGEAFVLAGKAGLSLETVYDAVKGGLAGSNADSLGVPLPLTAFMSEVLKSLMASGCSDLDHGAIIKFFEKISGDDI